MSEEQLRKTRRRYEVEGQPRFLTFSCRHRLPLLAPHRIATEFVADLHRARERLAFQLHAWVVMPEHVHLILTPRPDTDVPQLLRAVKGPIATRMAMRWRSSSLPLPNLEESNGRVRFWQPGGGYDRNIRSKSDLLEKINYIHANPVRRGLVGSPRDWEWSSARELMRQ